MIESAESFLAAAKELLRDLPVVSAWIRSILTATVIFCVMGCTFYLIERRTGRDLTRYRSKNFANDIFYTLLYQGGIYNILVYAPVFAIASSRVEFLRIDLLHSLPPLASILCYWIAVDFAAYWIHRMQHGHRYLWAFHSVHHSQTRMTYLTSNRNHVLEQLYVNLIMLTPVLVMGMPARLWMPVYFLQMFFEHAQHAQVRWRYGRLHGWFVSPAFHAMHHSTVEEEYNGNYGKIFSIWDRMFGTFVAAEEEPLAYGVEGMDVPESLVGQFAHPFAWLRRENQASPSAAPRNDVLTSAPVDPYSS